MNARVVSITDQEIQTITIHLAGNNAGIWIRPCFPCEEPSGPFVNPVLAQDRLDLGLLDYLARIAFMTLRLLQLARDILEHVGIGSVPYVVQQRRCQRLAPASRVVPLRKNIVSLENIQHPPHHLHGTEHMGEA